MCIYVGRLIDFRSRTKPQWRARGPDREKERRVSMPLWLRRPWPIVTCSLSCAESTTQPPSIVYISLKKKYKKQKRFLYRSVAIFSPHHFPLRSVEGNSRSEIKKTKTNCNTSSNNSSVHNSRIISLSKKFTEGSTFFSLHVIFFATCLLTSQLFSTANKFNMKNLSSLWFWSVNTYIDSA